MKGQKRLPIFKKGSLAAMVRYGVPLMKVYNLPWWSGGGWTSYSARYMTCMCKENGKIVKLSRWVRGSCII